MKLPEVVISCLVMPSEHQQPRFTASSWRASSLSSQWQKWIRPVRSLRSMTRMAPWSWSMTLSDADSACDAIPTRRICRSIPMCKDFIGSVRTNHKCVCHRRWVLCLCVLDCACSDEKDHVNLRGENVSKQSSQGDPSWSQTVSPNNANVCLHPSAGSSLVALWGWTCLGWKPCGQRMLTCSNLQWKKEGSQRWPKQVTQL